MSNNTTTTSAPPTWKQCVKNDFAKREKEVCEIASFAVKLFVINGFLLALTYWGLSKLEINVDFSVSSKTNCDT